MKDNSIINSLKRLERVGDETSRVTQKLKDACVNVAQEILEVIKDSGIIDVPDYYDGIVEYQLPCYLVDEERFTTQKAEKEDTNKKRHIVRLYVDCQDNWWLAYNDSGVTNSKLTGEPSREDALSFAWIVSKGLVGAVAGWIEAEKKKDEKRIEMLAIE
jgi:hypothetical protein